ncbi:putative serine peptidase [Magnetofaba australis IT-1]|uniref:Putative serine peptidase n=2 Tax=Magnetofaba TaxID=1472292 RepID=A0A1Y2K9U9_9PROT|nr:putative serine peptidase [Magnetofaba australis IT-1]
MAARVLGAPLMVDRARLETILSVLGPRIDIEPTTMATGFGESDGATNTVITPNGIAVVPIDGTLVKRAGAIDAASGLVSYAAIEERILDAATDPAVKAILLDIDSPGGEVGGVFDLAALIREAGQEKPIWALADDAFSAAYLIASCAHRIIVPQTAGVGSIGVIAVHVDESQKDAKEGRAYTTVFAGAHKNDFSSHAPLSDLAKSHLQQEVDRLYGKFVGAVAEGRGVQESAIRATEAGLFFGENAVSAGLADQVGTIRDALAGLTALLHSPKRTFVQKLEANMPIDETHKAEDSPPQAQTDPNNIIDLEQAREEKASQMRGEAKVIVDLCALADLPDLAGGYIAEGFSADQVRQELLAKRAASSGAEIHSEVMPGDGTHANPAQSLTHNPLVASCQSLAKRHAMGGE